MSAAPLYHPTVDLAAYQLRYAWTGWPAGGIFRHPPIDLIEKTVPLWEKDGLRPLEYRWTTEKGRIWSDGFYVGTFREYTIQAIRVQQDESGAHGRQS